MVGGIVGQSNGVIENCYNAGNVNTTGGWFTNAPGGLAGMLYYDSVINSYNYGIITAKDANTNTPGGIVGINGTGSTNRGTITNSYCTETSTTYSYNYSTSHYTKGRIPEATLKGYASTLNEKDEEGNEIEVWVNDTGVNNGYPILKWQIEQH